MIEQVLICGLVGLLWAIIGHVARWPIWFTCCLSFVSGMILPNVLKL